MEYIYLILVSICFILFGIASYFIVEITNWSVLEFFVLILPFVGITIAISSLIRFFKHKHK